MSLAFTQPLREKYACQRTQSLHAWMSHPRDTFIIAAAIADECHYFLWGSNNVEEKSVELHVRQSDLQLQYHERSKTRRLDLEKEREDQCEICDVQKLLGMRKMVATFYCRRTHLVAILVSRLEWLSDSRI